MKNLKKSTAFIIIAALMMAMYSMTASAATEMSVTFRVEGPDSNLYYNTLSVPYSDSLTAAQALDFLDEQSDELTFKGVSDGYISEVNNISSGKFGGWDGWYFAVNDISPDVGISDYSLSDNDCVVLYYGGYPCSIPIVNTDRLDSDRIIKFTSNDTEYDSDWNAVKVVNNIKDAKVTVNGTEYKTDENGEIKISSDNIQSEMSVQIDKKDSAGAPVVLRLAPDYTVHFNGTEDSDTSTDTSTVTDTDTNTSSDSDTDKNTSSKTSSTASSVSRTSSVSNSATVTKSSNTASTSASAAATGDGRIYLAVSVFIVAIVIVAIMFLLKRKSK